MSSDDIRLTARVLQQRISDMSQGGCFAGDIAEVSTLRQDKLVLEARNAALARQNADLTGRCHALNLQKLQVEAHLVRCTAELESARTGGIHSRKQVEAVRALLNMDTECARAAVAGLQQEVQDLKSRLAASSEAYEASLTSAQRHAAHKEAELQTAQQSAATEAAAGVQRQRTLSTQLKQVSRARSELAAQNDSAKRAASINFMRALTRARHKSSGAMSLACCLDAWRLACRQDLGAFQGRALGKFLLESWARTETSCMRCWIRRVVEGVAWRRSRRAVGARMLASALRRAVLQQVATATRRTVLAWVLDFRAHRAERDRDIRRVGGCHERLCVEHDVESEGAPAGPGKVCFGADCCFVWGLVPTKNRAAGGSVRVASSGPGRRRQTRYSMLF
eukprot:TRINITY_DN55599_c0_g1_i1.p1 TRINITY_DN55599_c0_g1~~TRINITY_DN55599_c0_g1_i1.p1  ORF type:complete len:394 (-),score=77.20 TRINITY_DN55599_c0_g1_i1:237-1418(-)